MNGLPIRHFKKSILFVALLLLSISNLFAHTLWIETNPTGVKGKVQDVKIFFGEFADKDISLAAKWFSDLKDFSLVVVAPDKSETKLLTVADIEFYKASFTPTQNGVYTLVMHHTVKDVYGIKKLQYNSSATVVVGKELNGNTAFVNSNNISLFSETAYKAKKDSELKAQAIYDNKLSAKQKIEVFAPNGWAKELYSSKDGEIKFTPIWSGKYMLEFAYTDKTPGEHNGKNYEEIRKVATYIIYVK